MDKQSGRSALRAGVLELIISKLKIKDLRNMAESPTGERFTIDEYGRIFFGVTGDKVKF